MTQKILQLAFRGKSEDYCWTAPDVSRWASMRPWPFVASAKGAPTGRALEPLIAFPRFPAGAHSHITLLTLDHLLGIQAALASYRHTCSLGMCSTGLRRHVANLIFNRDAAPGSEAGALLVYLRLIGRAVNHHRVSGVKVETRINVAFAKKWSKDPFELSSSAENSLRSPVWIEGALFFLYP